MIGLYNQFFKIVYITFFKKLEGDNPEWKAAILLPMIICFNVIVISILLGIVKYITGVIDFRLFILILYVSSFIANYFFFIRNKKYVEYGKEFKLMSEVGQKRIFRIGVAISIMGYVIPILLIALMLS